VIRIAPPTLLIVLLTILGVPAGAGGVWDDAIPRPLRFDRPPVSPSAGRTTLWTPAGHPDGFEPRAFPSLLRDRSLPAQPDGILWRRLRAQYPGLDPLELAVPSPRAVDALMAQPATLGRGAPDTVRVLALRVDFLKDSAGTQSSTLDGRFDLRHPDSAQVAVDPPPHNRSYFSAHLAAVDRYYRTISGGAIVLDWDVYPTEEDSAYHLADTADYGPWTMGSDEEILALAERFVRDSFAAADTSADPPEFHRYDSFLLFHAGSDYQSDMNRNSPYDIPSFNIQMATGSEVAVQDSTFFIDLILVVPETVSQDGYLGVLNGVLAHEYGHQLGFFDLYNVLNFYPMVGMFSLMDSGESLYGQVWDPYREMAVYVRGAIPASLDPWQKLLFFRSGVNARWIDRGGTYDLPAVELHNDLLLIPVGYPDPEPEPGETGPLHLLSPDVFILENRQFDLNGDGTVFLEADSATGVILGPRNVPEDMLAEMGLTEPDTLGRYEVDYLLPGSGILIWHVDTQALADAFNYCYGCVNIFPGRHAVGLVEADGIPDLGDIYSVEWTGGALDYWSPETYNHFGPATDPSSAAGSGAFTGISMTVLDSAAVTMRVAVDVGYRREGWPIFAGGVPGPESIEVLDVDGDDVPEILVAAGHFMQILSPDGLSRAAQFDSVLLPGVAARSDFAAGGDSSMPIICVATNRNVYGWDPRSGALLLDYPGSAAASSHLRFTTTPMVLDSIIVVGDAQGRVRGLHPWWSLSGAEPPAGENQGAMVWRTPTAGFAVTALAAGPLLPGGGEVLAWGNETGEVRLAGGSQWAGFTALAGWPRRMGVVGDGGIAWLRLVAGAGGDAGFVLACSGGGALCLWDPDGATRAGWPVDMGASPAGPPAIGDPDGDGCLEIVCTDVAGNIHVYDLQGRPEAHWPRSVWHPDARWRKAVRSSPVLIDLHPAPAGDGIPEIVQADGQGALHALDAHGAAIDGWPRAAGYAVTSGPFFAGLGPEGGLQMVAGDLDGYVTVLKTEYAGREMRPGEGWSPQTDPGHAGFYAASRLPAASFAGGLLQTSGLLFTPNPVMGAEGLLRVQMGRPGSLDVQLYDTSGQRVWERQFHPQAGAQGDVLALDLSGVAPGLYVAKIVARADGEALSVMRKLAIVR